MGVKDKRKAYAEKIINEFTELGFDLKRAFGVRGTINSVTKSENAFNDFKRRVRATRSYYKERETIKKEVEAYKQKRVKDQNTRRKESLVKVYGKEATKNGVIRHIWNNRNELGLNSDIDFLNKSKIQSAIVDNFRKTLEEVQTIDNGKKQGGLFKNHAEEHFVKDSLNELYEIAKNDKMAIKNLNTTFNYIYEKIIPMKYNAEQGGEYSPIKKADKNFWKDVSKKVLDYYKTLDIEKF